MTQHLIWFEDLRLDDVPRVGGKNASLGEMIHQLSNAGVRVPDGFATTADAFREFLEHKGLADRIYGELDDLDIDDVDALAKTGERIRQWIIDTPFPPALQEELHEAINKLQKEQGEEISFAVRSSATAEDLPEASFAGQQETYLNIKGEDNLLDAIHHVFASLFNDRAITYRVHNEFDHRDVALSAGVQRMIRSDIGASGVIFTIDTESGFEDVVFITAAYGLGETVVQGQVNPDEFYVFKPMLEQNKQAVIRRNLGQKGIRMVYGDDTAHAGSTRTEEVPRDMQRQFSINDEEAMELARQAVTIENHYGRHMDIEWARDGLDGKLYIVQARPETVKSRSDRNVLEQYEMQEYGKVLSTGRSIGQRIGSGVARTIMNIKEMSRLQKGDVLITEMTDPDWEPVMKRASAIVTNRGGRTCHAAIIARELGIPAVVGCGNATEAVTDGNEVTV
ncbi:MAG: phosphoenolpyruvate synthase, partial [Pseudomonadota bacterium]